MQSDGGAVIKETPWISTIPIMEEVEENKKLEKPGKNDVVHQIYYCNVQMERRVCRHAVILCQKEEAKEIGSGCSLVGDARLVSIMPSRTEVSLQLRLKTKFSLTN